MITGVYISFQIKVLSGHMSSEFRESYLPNDAYWRVFLFLFLFFGGFFFFWRVFLIQTNLTALFLERIRVQYCFCALWHSVLARGLVLSISHVLNFIIENPHHISAIPY